MDTSSLDQTDEMPMSFQEWTVDRTRRSGIDPTLFSSEALEHDIDAYEHEYLGQHPNAALMLVDFRTLRRQIQETKQ
jgi:hypothetical protein